MPDRDPKKFDPARAHLLDAPERERYLPTAALIGALELRGDELVVDYGAGTGRLTVAAADALTADGQVVAVDESPEMVERLRERVGGRPAIQVMAISDNRVPLDDGAADRILAVNLLHEIRGEGALREMRRLLAPGGRLLAVDWERGRERPSGPPDRILFSAEEAGGELRAAGFDVETLDLGLPYHYALRARPVTG